MYERDLYYCVNIVRNDPKFIFPTLDQVRKLHSDHFKHLNKAFIKAFKQFLGSQEKQPCALFLKEANEACAENNKEKMKDSEDGKEIEKGGNLEIYKKNT